MPGIGDSWGTKEELLHPRGPNGRWIHKAGVAKSIIQAVLDFLSSFKPRTFQSRQQSNQYLQNIASRQGVKRMRHTDLIRLGDLGNANADLRDGVIDEPSTQKFVDMMDRSATELPDDVILTRVVGTDAFGFTPETAKGTDADADPGIRGLSGKLVADRGYSLTTIGGVTGTQPQGTVRMVIAAKKGTKVVVPAGGPNDSTVFLDRGQPMRITKIEPDGAGGWVMFVTAEPHDGHDVPEPMGGPVGAGRKPSREREASLKESQRRLGKVEKRPDEEAEAADEAERRRLTEEAARQPATPSPAQEAERRRVEELQQQPPRQPAPGEPPPRTEPVVGRVGEAPGAGTQPPGPQPTVPEAPAVPRRSVDLRLAVRDSQVPSPSAGPRRKAWNEAYLGVSNGKKDPLDAVRELDADIKTLQSGHEIGRGAERFKPGQEESRQSDIDALQGLRDVIAREYGLEGPTPEKKATRKVTPRTEAGLPKLERPPPPVKAAKKVAAPAAPAPAKKSLPGLSREQEDSILARAKEFEANPRNAEEQRIVDTAARIRARREAEAPGAAKKVAKKAAPAAKKAVPAPAKKATKKAAPEAPGDDLEGMTNAQLLEVAKKEHATAGPGMTKAQLKEAIRSRRYDVSRSQLPLGEQLATVNERADLMRRARIAGHKNPANLTNDELRKFVAEHEGPKKAVPEAPGDDLDKMTKAELLAEAERRQVDVPKSWTKDKIKTHLREERFRTPEKRTAAERGVQRKADQALAQKMARQLARETAGNPDTVRQQLIGTPAEDRHRYLEDLVEPLNLTETRRLAKGLSVRGQDRNNKPDIIQAILRHFEGADDVEAIRRLEGAPEVPAPAKKAAKAVKAAPPHAPQAAPVAPSTSPVAQAAVPEGSVAGPRARSPIDNAPRKRSLEEAWDEAGIGGEGAAARSMQEIRDDVSAGRITPEEGIRRMESEISFNKEDLAEVDANLRQEGLSDADRTRLQSDAAKLQNAIDEQEKASRFLRLYFKDEQVTTEEAKVNDPVAFEFLKDATPDDMKEAAKQIDLDPPKGDTPDEMFQDLIRQVAAKELARRAAKKAPAKKAVKAAKKAAPAVPRERERVDARLLAEGIENLDEDTIASVQADLDEGKLTPNKIAEKLDGDARLQASSTVIRYGDWGRREDPESPDYDPELSEDMRQNYQEGMSRVRAIQELSGRLRGMRRRPAKKAAPAKVTPEVRTRDEQIEDLQARIINNALEEMSKAKSRDKGDDALEGLTMPELRRLAEQSGVKPPRTKRALRDALLDHFMPEPEAPTTGPSGRPRTLGARTRAAGIEHPGETFSDVDSAVGEADRRLQGGESPTTVARFLRERAARVSRADLDEEGRRFKVEHDRDSLRSIRKSSAEYLRRVATHVQQEGKASRPAKKAAPSAPEGTDLARGIQIQARGGFRESEPPPARPGLPPEQKVLQGGPVRTGREVTDSNGRIVPRDRPRADEPVYLPNNGNDQGMVHFDSELGKLWSDLYGDDREPNSFINEIAHIGEDVGTGKLPLAQAIERLKRLKGRATDQAVADRIQSAIDRIDAPTVDLPDLPDTVPDAVRRALRQLADIPTARKKGRVGLHYRDKSVLEEKVDIVRRIDSSGRGPLDRELEGRDLHESADGAMEMWRIFERLMTPQWVVGYRRDESGRSVPIEEPNPDWPEIQAWIRNARRRG